ncbi:alpha/beta fold hydrolase [Methylomonas albis]|uniref:Alpha/beta hydrolase n=1 Tax=Methylomonas albis TaxID=1854563 RepID=A0ABR9D5I1_9GAMM|nr:alpha/beta hydrolase [Methylomonas albis]MBD9358379.1 alpha/beta hydrolase [Methylomonas albis]
MKFRPSVMVILLLLLIMLSGCAATTPNVTMGKVSGRQVEFAISKHGTVPVVFEAGLDGTFAWWDDVYPAIAQDATALVYNRAGYGNSETVEAPRDGRHIVEELRSLLASRGLAPPYVLVGHSLGGLYMQWYARYHPQEVAALILVDSTHPSQLKGAGAIENWPMWVRLAFGLLTSATAERELAALDLTGDEVLAAPPFTRGPVIVLSAAQPLSDTSALAIDGNQKRKDISRLYPGAIQRWVDSGHAIPLEKPEPIVSAIREVLSITWPNSAKPTASTRDVLAKKEKP